MAEVLSSTTPLSKSHFDVGFTKSGNPRAVAPTSRTNTITTRLAALNQSTDSFDHQIQEAFSILNIGPEDEAPGFSGFLSENNRAHGFGPLEEWLIKWVFRKFQPVPGSYITAGSPCTYFEAWKLVTIAIQRLPSQRAAGILKAADFINAVQSTLAWLSHSTTHQTDLPLAAKEDTSQSESSGSSSSGTLQLTPPNSEPPKKKRKRNGTNQVPVQKATYSPCALYKHIIGSLSQITSLIENEDEATQLRYFSRVKCSNETAAKVLGCSLSIIYDEFSSFQDWGSVDGAKSSINPVQPIFFLWRHSSSLADGANQRASNAALFNHILIPSLRLLQHCQSQNDCFTSSLIIDLIPFVKSNLMIPLRAAFRQREKSSGAAQYEQDIYIAELLAPLRSLVVQTIQSVLKKQQTHVNLDLVKSLFCAALDSVTLTSSKDRRIEGPWLRLLFSTLVHYLGLLPPIGKDEELLSYVLGVLKEMIRLAQLRNVPLDSIGLKQILDHYFDLNEITDRSPDWDLMHICLAAQPDLLFSAFTGQAANVSALGQPSETLLSALSRFGQDKIRSTLLAELNKDIDNEVVPVLRAFLHKKQLNELLKHWQEQLLSTRYLPALARDALNCTIWDNEKILTTISKEIDHTLTKTQVIEWFRVLLEDFSQSSIAAEGLDKSRPAQWRSNFLLLDCFLSGLKSEDVIAELQTNRSFQKIFDTLSSLLTITPAIPDIPRWRIWRILTRTMVHLAKIPGARNSLTLHQPFKDLCAELAADYNLVYDVQGARAWSGEYQERFQVFEYLVIWDFATTRPQRTHFSTLAPSPFLQGLSDSLAQRTETCVELCKMWGNCNGQIDYMKTRSGRKDSDILALECVTWLVSNVTWLSINGYQVDASLLSNVVDTGRLRLFAMSHHLLDDNFKVMTRSDPTCEELDWNYPEVWKVVMSSGILEEDIDILRGMIGTLLSALGDSWDERPDPVWNHDLEFTFDALLQLSVSWYKSSDRMELVATILSKISLSTETHDTDGYELESENKVAPNGQDEQTSSDDRNGDNGKDDVEMLTGSDVAEDQKSHEPAKHYMNDVTVERASTLLFIFTNPLTLDMPLVDNPACFLKHADLFAKDYFINQGYRPPKVFKEVVRRLITFAISESTKNHNAKPFLELINIAKRKAQPGVAENAISGTEIWSLIVLSFVEDHALQSGTTYRELSTILQNVIHVFTKRLMSLIQHSDLDLEHPLEFSLDLLTCLPDAALTKFDSPQILQAFTDYCVLRRHKESSIIPEYEIVRLCGQVYFRLHEANKTYTATSFTPWGTCVHERFKALPEDVQARVLIDIFEPSPTGDRKQDLLHIQLHLKHIRDITENTSADLRDLLENVFLDLCREVTTATSPHCCMLQLKCIDYMLRKHHTLIKQHHVEEALYIICAMAGPNAPALTNAHGHQLLMALCQLFISLLRKHRLKLGGRYHIVTATLQCLLRCLFTPNPKQRTSMLLPPWLLHNESHASPDEAETLAVILTMLCEPAPSVVERSRAALNDATKKARDRAGQMLLPVIEEFCASQLTGKIQPEVRRRLMPGIWALISATRRSHLRAMNDGFAGTEIPDVWKMVFDEWEKARK